MIPADNWKLSEETHVRDVDKALKECFISTAEEKVKHEDDACWIFMPNQTGILYPDMKGRTELYREFLQVIRNSENVVYSAVLAYKDNADRKEETLQKEEKGLVGILNILNCDVISILQKMHAEAEENHLEKMGTEIESLAAFAHFKERYSLPHVHFVYLAPKQEFTILFNSYLRHLPRDLLHEPLSVTAKEGE